MEDVLAIAKNSYDSENNTSSVLEDFGTESNPMLNVNAGARFNSHKQGYAAHTTRTDPDMGTADRLYLKMSAYMVYCDRIYDLLTQRPGTRVKMDHYIDPQTQ